MRSGKIDKFELDTLKLLVTCKLDPAAAFLADIHNGPLNQDLLPVLLLGIRHNVRYAGRLFQGDLLAILFRAARKSGTYRQYNNEQHCNGKSHCLLQGMVMYRLICVQFEDTGACVDGPVRQHVPSVMVTRWM